MRVILFNLAPYRERRHRLMLRAFGKKLGIVLAVTALLSFSIQQSLASRERSKQAYLDRVQAIERSIQAHAAEVASLKKKKELLQKQVDLLRSIDADSNLSSALLSVIDRTLPKSLSLTQIKVSRQEVQLYGQTPDVEALANWTQSLKGFPAIFQDASLVSVNLIDSKNGTKSVSPERALHKFELHLKVAAKSFPTLVTEEEAHGGN